MPKDYHLFLERHGDRDSFHPFILFRYINFFVRSLSDNTETHTHTSLSEYTNYSSYTFIATKINFGTGAVGKCK